MSTTTPTSAKAWTVTGYNSFDDLKLQSDFSTKQPSDNEVLVKFHAASLNYRDLIIPLGKRPSIPGHEHENINSW